MKQAKETLIAMKNTPEDQKEIQPVHDAAENQISWSMSASSGRAGIQCRLVTRSERSDALVCHIKIVGEFWQRGRIKRSLETTNDFTVVLPQVVMDLTSLRALRQRLVEWQINPSGFSFELGARGEGDQKLTFLIGQDDDLIYSVDKPACALSYSCRPAIEGRWVFVVDQSCIRLCAESIDYFVKLVEY